MSFKPYVIVDSRGKWCGTPLRALQPGKKQRPTFAIWPTAGLPSPTPAWSRAMIPVKYSWRNGKLIAVEK